MSRPVTTLHYGGHTTVREILLVFDMAEVPWAHLIRHVRPRASFFGAYGYVETSAIPILPVLLFGSASQLFPAAWPGGLVRRQAYSKMINDHCGKRCLRRQSRGILDAEKKLEPSNAAITEIVLVSFGSHSQQQALLLASSDTVDTRG